MKFPIHCRVCHRIEEHKAEGWLLCIIDRRGNFHATKDLDLTNLRTTILAGAYVCGQGEALILFERFLDRGTFEAVNAIEPGYLAELLHQD